MRTEIAGFANRDFLLARMSHRSGMLLNSDELVSLVHLPSASVRAEKLKRSSKKTRAAPASAQGHEFLIGETTHNGRNVEETLSPEQRTRHMYVVGASGTGTSTLLLQMVIQDIERGDGLAVFDPHGDLIDQILSRVPEHRLKDVVLVDPSDDQFPVGFNILSAHSEIEKSPLSSEDFSSYLDELSADDAGHEETVRGYKVRTRVKAVSEAEAKVRKQAISQVLLRGKRRMNNKEH